MPVNRPPQGGHIGRSRRRLSSSSLTTFERCKGQWLLKTQVGLQQPANLPMILGHVIEDAVCQLLMRHPPLCTSKEELTTWCYSEIDAIIELAVEQFANMTEMLPKFSLDFSSKDLDKDDIKQRLLRSIPLILEEVEDCYEQHGGPFLEGFRTGGDVFEVPSPCLSKPPCHPYPEYVQSSQPEYFGQMPIWQGKDDQITWNEAWEISRPWFKDPRIFQPQRLYHPDDWASGELDIVYRWSGAIHIIDIKSGNSTSPFSSSLQSQLEFYAWLWSACFDGEIPTHLSGWYLGDGKHIEYQALSKAEIEMRNTSYMETHHEMKNLVEGIVEFPLSEQLRCEGIKAGCSWCSARIENDVMNFKSKHADMNIPNFEFSPPFQQLSTIQSRVHVRGKLTGGWGPLPNHFGEYVLGCVLVVGDQHVVVEENEPGLFSNLHQYLDQEVVIEHASSGVWRDQPRLYLDEKSKISLQHGDFDLEITRLGLLQTRANIEGVILSVQQQSGTRLNGKPWTMLSFSIWDGKNIAEMVAFGSSISNTLLDLNIGAIVKVMSAEIGWRNGLLQLRIDSRKTRIEIQSN